MERTDHPAPDQPESAPGKLKFSPGHPSLTSVNARRVSQDNYSTGTLNASFNTTITLSEDKRTVIAEVSVEAQGVGTSSDNPIFEISCTFSCPFRSSTIHTDESIQNKQLAAILSAPLYHRAVLLIEAIARDMGFPGIQLPLIPPSESAAMEVPEIPEPPTESVGRQRQKRKATSKT